MKTIKPALWALALALLALSAADAQTARQPTRRQSARAAAPQDDFDLEKELAKPRFQFEMGPRRVPFQDPRIVNPAMVERTGGRPKIETPDPGALAEERQALRVAAIKLKEAEEAIAAGQFDVGVERLAEAETLLTRPVASPELAGEFGRLKSAADALAKQTQEHRVQLVRRTLEGQMDEARQLFELKEYGAVVERCDAARTARLPIVDESVETLLDDFGDLAARALLRQEFARHQVAVQGVALGERRDVTLVNGQTVRIGEPLPGAPAGKGKAPAAPIADTEVTAIGPNSVVVLYKGEPIELRIKD